MPEFILVLCDGIMRGCHVINLVTLAQTYHIYHEHKTKMWPTKHAEILDDVMITSFYRHFDIFFIFITFGHFEQKMNFFVGACTFYQKILTFTGTSML